MAERTSAVCRVAVVVLLGVGWVAVAGEAPRRRVPADVGLVTRIEGEVHYRSVLAPDKEHEAVPFMKVRAGDRFRLGKKAGLRLLYYRSGRQETWTGPARFRAAQQKSKTRGKARPAVKSIPVRASRDVRRVPALLRRVGGGRVGATPVRSAGGRKVQPVGLSPEERAELDAARDVYATMRARAPADDITPELYLLGVLYDYERYDEMASVVTKARAIQPASQALSDIQAWLEERGAPVVNPGNP